MSVDRLFSIMLILSNKGKKTAAQLAERLEVSPRTIYRDIHKLSLSGIPIYSEDGRSGGYYLMEDYKVDNLYFKEDDMKPILSILKNIQNLFGDNGYLNEIINKYENVNEKNNFTINMTNVSMIEEIKNYLHTTSMAIDNKKVIKLQYVNRRQEVEERMVEPIYISYSSGEWYINGFCRNRNDYRSFKLTRIKNLVSLDFAFDRDIDIDTLKNIYDRDFKNISIKVVLKFHPKFGPQLTEYFAKENIQKCADGYFIAHEFYPHDEGLIKHILGYGKWCQVLEPEYLKQEIKDYLNEMVKNYE
ncbi:helix-turn-helix transcriptional regulator [Oceanirhabdus seepicola]|uniref:YafY family transcriptional regulator n=1 Tax=Oceanirhabdus seepicola TaxID=2828781 RepID=A0A9J6P620_9CLOT|nr:YafY family protein [Oceanirhabdus seepicola]MCM1992167.1 YafY family transcriptional regulator [Oceanirhabdus seepicola]